MPDSTAGSEKFRSISGNRAKISVKEPGVASCRQLMDNGMASVSQLNPYQCDQCGTANIVAAPVLYQQGTHTYSTRFHSGTTQSFSAQAVTPPRVRGFLRPLLVWGPAIAFFTLWTFIGFDSILKGSAPGLQYSRQSWPSYFWLCVSLLLQA